MDDFANLLQRDYGLKPQGKSAPMASSRAGAPYVPAKASGSQGGSLNRGNNGSAGLSARTSNLQAEDALGDGMFFGSTNLSNKSGKNAYAMADSGFGSSKSSFDDVFGDSLSFGVSKQPSKSSAPAYDDIFSTPIMSSTSKSHSFPVYDMPKYDDDIFGGVPGMRRNSSAPYEDVFGMGASRVDASNDLLGGFAVAEPSRSKPEAEHFLDASSSGLEDLDSDELLPGFGSSELFKTTSRADAKPSQTPIDNPLFSVGGLTSRSSEMDPFSGLTSDPIGLGNSSSAAASTFVDPLEDPFEMRIPQAHGTVDINLKPKENAKNTVGNDVFDGIFQSKASVHSRSSKATIVKDEAVIPSVASDLNTSLPEADYVYSTSMNHKVDHFPPSPPRQEANDYFSSSEPVFANPKKKSVRFDEPVMKNEGPELSQTFTPPDSSQRTIKEVWVTIDDVRLVTKPTKALPPSRPAPRFDLKRTSAMRKSEFKTNIIDHSEVAQDFLNETSSRVPTYRTSSIEDLENFVSGGFHPEGNTDFCYEEEQSPATKLKEASERVEGRLKTAKEGREKDREEKDREAKAAKLKEEREEREKEARIIQEREAKEKEAREERERQRREIEREREKDRAAVDRATHEARERAAEKAVAEARERAERAAAEARQRAERVAVERVTAEARERAAAEAREKAATEAREQAAAEARERAAADAKQRAERAAVERATAEARGRAERAAVERVNAEARERAAEKAAAERAAAEVRERAEKAAERAAERAAAERAAAEVRERAEKAAERAAVQRAAAEARERAEKAAAQRAASAAAAARSQQQRSDDNDFEQFFNMSSSRAASAPKQRPSTSESVPEYKGRSPTAAPTVRKVSSTTNIVDDWTSLFATPSTAEFQEIEGEAPERRKARWERYQRTLERSAKALAEKNQRDLDAQREQAEKHRAADSLDAEIRRWAAGKDGNLRALLSTLQYVLWPECGWQPVSLTDLITGASVKKVYRKATLYVHPDKVQQKGATVQQKYVAEKVFDLLKEAWNKFNSEELF